MIAAPQRANSNPHSNINFLASPGWKSQSIPDLPVPLLPSLDRVRHTQQTYQNFLHPACQYLQQPAPLTSLSDRFANATDHYPGPICPSETYSRQLTTTSPGHPAALAYNPGSEFPSLPGFYVPPNNHSFVPNTLTFEQRPQPRRVGYNTSHSNGSLQGYPPSILSRNPFPTLSRPVRGAMDLSKPANSQNAGIGAVSSSRLDSASPPAHPAAEPSPKPPLPRRQIDPIIVASTPQKRVKSNTSAEVGPSIRNGNDDGGPDEEGFYDTIIVRPLAQMRTLSTAPIRNGNVDGNDGGPDEEGFYDTIVVRPLAQMRTLSTAPIRNGNVDGNDDGPDEEGFYDTIVVRPLAQMRTLSKAPAPGKGIGERTRTNERIMLGTEVDTSQEG
ncbi:hypothetical protein BGX38DRAFT_1206441 [Terfezia claveryi]|nr:hypothetical protein BGX38DRAFT_1206441 [Terfezia claveryi]